VVDVRTIHIFATEWPETAEVKRSLFWRLVRRVSRETHLTAAFEEPPGSGLMVVIEGNRDGVGIWVDHWHNLGRFTTDLIVKDAAQIDVPRFNKSGSMAWFGPHTCVTMVKRLIGLNAWWIQTPSQLMRAVKRGQR